MMLPREGSASTDDKAFPVGQRAIRRTGQPRERGFGAKLEGTLRNSPAVTMERRKDAPGLGQGPVEGSA